MFKKCLKILKNKSANREKALACENFVAIFKTDLLAPNLSVARVMRKRGSNV